MVKGAGAPGAVKGLPSWTVRLRWARKAAQMQHVTVPGMLEETGPVWPGLQHQQLRDHQVCWWVSLGCHQAHRLHLP